MALTERTAVSKTEIVGEFKHVQVGVATIIDRDGVEISRTLHRHVIAPDSDVSGESKDIQAVCAIYHTDEVKKAYAAHLKSLQVEAKEKTKTEKEE